MKRQGAREGLLRKCWRKYDSHLHAENTENGSQQAVQGGVGRGVRHGVMHLAYLPLICILSSYPCCFLYPSARAGATDCVTKGTHEPRLGLDFSFGASLEVAYANRRGRRLRRAEAGASCSATLAPCPARLPSAIPRPWPRNYGSHVHNLHKSMQYMRNAMSLSQLIYAACVCVWVGGWLCECAVYM